ncbi:MAG: hypothetical protein ACLR3R_18755 [Clostridium paraputrificum]
MINVKEVLEGLKKMVGTKFDEVDIIEAFGETDEEIIVNEVEGQESNFDGHGICKCYNAYENAQDSEIFIIYVNGNNEVVDVR